MENSLAQKFKKVIKSIFKESCSTTYTLFKIMIPAIIAVKILEEAGAIDYLSVVLTPVMGLVGLPASAGLIWATALLTNIYSGIAVFASFAGQEEWTVAQATILGTMILVAHGLPVEVRIAQKAGCRVFTHFMIRFLGAYVLGGILYFIYSKLNYLQEPLQTVFPEFSQKQTLMDWALGQVYMCVMIFGIIICLIALLKLLRYLHIERMLGVILQPILKSLGIKTEATSITLIGITLGLSYGGGLLIKEAESGNVSKEDVFASVTFLGLSHSLIEDTLLVMAMGGHLSGILWGRFIFTLIVVFFLVRFLRIAKEEKINKYWVGSVVRQT